MRRTPLHLTPFAATTNAVWTVTIMRLATVFALFFIALGVTAKKKSKVYPRAEVKVSYNYHHLAQRNDEKIISRDYEYLLLANSEYSKYYNIKNEYLDSLDSTPEGRRLHNQLITIGLNQYSKSGDRSAIPGYKGRLYVFKSNNDSVTTVYDSYGLIEIGYYKEPFREIEWTITDSTKTVLGYECIMAETDYHGRHWRAWFSPEIPLQDGPWKLRGLPGLILEASDSSVQHNFFATGIENSDMEMNPVYQPEKYDKMKRIDMLKAYADYRKSSSTLTKALIENAPEGSEFKIKVSNQPQSNFQKIDLLETDYH